MKTQFFPAREDVDRYLKLRAASMELNRSLVETIPNQAYYDIGEALGFLHDGVLVYEKDDMSCVMSDCCIYDWYEGGKNVAQRYAETHPAQPGTDEHYLLNAYLHAKYRVLVVQTPFPGAGIDCRDILNNEDLFVMDVAFSRTAEEGSSIAARTIPLGEYWMTTGAGLPVASREAMKDAVRRIERGPLPKAMRGRAAGSLTMVRACLDNGAAERIFYETAKRREPRHIPRRTRHRV